MNRSDINPSSEKEKIVGIAQHFGFGAFSYLFSIMREVRKNLGNDQQYSLLGTRNVEIFYDQNPGVFDEMIETKDNDPGFDGEDPAGRLAYFPEGSSHVISTFEPYSIFYAWFHNIDSSYFTELFWMWDIKDLEPCISEYLDKLNQLKNTGKFEEALAFFCSIGKKNHHHTIFLAYFLAQQSYVLQGEGVQERLDRFPDLQDKTLITPGLVPVPDGLTKMPYEDRNTILIQLAGSTTPLIPIDYNVRFAKGLLSLILDVYYKYEGADKLEWIMVCNPLVFDQIGEGLKRQLPNNFKLIKSVPQAENFRMMARSKAVFMSPTLGAYEASYFNTPVFLLPEQNGGQPANYKKLLQRDFDPKDNITIFELLDRDFSGDEPEKINDLYRAHASIFYGEKKGIAQEQILSFLYRTKHLQEIHKTIMRQRDGFSFAMGGFNGLQVVSEHIVQRLKRV